MYCQKKYNKPYQKNKKKKILIKKQHIY
jgi:hypothetical protein